MAASINNGWVNLRASNFMANYTNKIANNVTRLSGNTKFATGADNPSAFAYGQRLRSAAAIATQNVENVQNAQTKAKIAGSAYSSVLDILSQAKDLAAQAEASGDSDADNSDAIKALTGQVLNIASAATFAGNPVFGSEISPTLIGDTGASEGGEDGDDDDTGGTGLTSPADETLGTTVSALQTNIENILGYQAEAGGLEAGLGYLADFLTNKAAYMQEAAANTLNVNITTEMSDYVSNQIALQSAQFIAAQQNQNAYSVLNLLK